MHPAHRPYALVFAGLALAFATLSYQLGTGSVALGWLALTAALVALAYARGNPGLFGKRADGSLPTWRRIALFPYVALVHAVWHGQRRFSGEAPWHEVAPGIYLGRWPRTHDCPKEVTLVVDLTAELPREIAGDVEYVLVPTLDGCSPSIEELERLGRKIADHDGVAYVHCAAGHGRSATVVAAALALRGNHGDLDAVIQHLRSVRPGVRINAVQRRVLERWAATRGT